MNIHSSSFQPTLFKMIFALGLISIANQNAFALTPIIRPFDSVRAEGMGDVRYTTGLYEENFFANPARATENPESQFQFPQFTFEAGSATLSAVSKLSNSGSNGLSTFSDSVGKPISARFQLVFPAFYSRHFITDKWSLGIGMIVSAQTVSEVSQSGQLDPLTFLNLGPALTLARRLLDEDRLSVGVTLHTEYRASSNSLYSVSDYIEGKSLSNLAKGGSGLGVDFDLGTTFRPHWVLGGFEYELGFAINNLLGGTYTNLHKKIAGWTGDPTQTPRNYNLGVSATHKHIPVFDSVKLAIETTDNGNNADGSFYRTLHLGAEAVFSVLSLRAGVNQGYLAAGLGVNVGFFDLNFATYGEEVGLNAGDMQDRRYALEFGFQI